MGNRRENVVMCNPFGWTVLFVKFMLRQNSTADLYEPRTDSKESAARLLILEGHFSWMKAALCLVDGCDASIDHNASTQQPLVA